MNTDPNNNSTNPQGGEGTTNTSEDTNKPNGGTPGNPGKNPPVDPNTMPPGDPERRNDANETRQGTNQ